MVTQGMLHLTYIDKAGLTVGIIISFLFGGWSTVLTALLVIQILDIITGVLVALKTRELSASQLREGLIKKFGIWVIVILGHFIDTLIFPGTGTAVTAIAFAFVGNEGISITENLANIGLPIPETITKYLKQIKNKDGDNKIEGA
ncbi:phage holin family protein [Enterococcus casseliflavus]|uniref:phage holin family protein n=1 Tax=Enterococcus casseliflavus TaxID=37734 RepID=UPI002DBC34B5|nr:phage holin family protein [Enterococcus casseliflavus]MEB6213507.1 phage holin family protein [Enterococcus casseliflavus]